MKRTPATIVLTALAVGATSLAAAAQAPSSSLVPSDRPPVSRDVERAAGDHAGLVEQDVDRGMAASGARYTAAGAAATPGVHPSSSEVGRYGAAVFASLLDQGLSRGMAASGARLSAEAAAYNAGHGSGTTAHGVTVVARP